MFSLKLYFLGGQLRYPLILTQKAQIPLQLFVSAKSCKNLAAESRLAKILDTALSRTKTRYAQTTFGS